MTELLCMLLYLLAIVTPATYTHEQIDAYEAQYYDDIQVILNDQSLYNQVIEDYTSGAMHIVITDPEAD